MALLRGVFVIAAKRTPFGAYGGLLKDFTATDLSEFATKAALSAGKVSPETVDSVIVGNVLQSSSDAPYLARHVGLRVGIPKEIPALTINRLCGSGFQSIVNGCQLEDYLWVGLTDQHIKLPMAITAENLAVKHKISREECDKYALQSQQRWKAANDAGFFNNEMASIEVKTKKGKQIMEVDEHARPQTTLEQLQKLPPVFKKDGTVTAGNASGIADGAGAVIIASENAVKKHNFTPLARIVGYFVAGCDPSIMGIGPVPAINGALKKAGLSLKDMDLVEVNEAFAPQYLAVEKSLDLDPSKTNVNGGAIALGHPLGGSGSRITAHLVHELSFQEELSVCVCYILVLMEELLLLVLRIFGTFCSAEKLQTKPSVEVESMPLDQLALEVAKVLLSSFRTQPKETNELTLTHCYSTWPGHSKTGDLQSSCHNWPCPAIETVIEFHQVMVTQKCIYHE
uniref:Acetyl-CoA acyltransferase 2 n=1 Tax=Callithrix jacchus TaxID=9483 RepID=A0A2R8MAM4_CALJA